LHAAECHVSILGDDGNEGPALKPFKTVSMAAAIAQLVRGSMSPQMLKKATDPVITKFLAFSPLYGG
jgi:hypothetical protein